MRKVAYLGILLSLFFVPLEQMDIANLLPIETVAIYIEDGQVVLETNTHDSGRGDTVKAALQNLKETTPAVVYLDTARYLLVSETATVYVDDFREYLKPSVEVAVCDARYMVEDGAAYFETHRGTVQLRVWNAEKISSENVEKMKKPLDN